MIEKIRAAMIGEVDNQIEKLLPILRQHCESPIDVALGMAILMHDRIIAQNPMSMFVARDPERYPDECRLLVPQFYHRNKRIDFLLIDSKNCCIFVECDGHDFHERTKEQAMRDRRRDRDLQRSGVPILRFTGAEIYRDPAACAHEIFDILIERTCADAMGMAQ